MAYKDFQSTAQRPARRAFLKQAGALTLLSLAGGCGASAVPKRRGDDVAKAAMLLPLSGQHGDLGSAIAKAVWLVEDTGGARNRVNILDGGTTPETAALAARQAVAGGAEIIIGPLFSTQTAAVVTAVAPVPVMTLSNDETLAKAGAWTFGVTPAQSVQAMLRFARAQGAASLAYLPAKGPVGGLASAAIAKGARAGRIKVMTPLSAAATKGDLVAALRAEGAGRLPDMFYVPGADSGARRAAAQAQKAGIQTVGSLQWAGLGPDDLAQLDKACFAGPDPARFARLSVNYRARLEQELGILSALAVDAAAIAATARRKPGGAFTLTSKSQTEGLLGRCRFLNNRTCERELAMLRIEGGSVRKVA